MSPAFTLGSSASDATPSQQGERTNGHRRHRCWLGDRRKGDMIEHVSVTAAESIHDRDGLDDIGARGIES
jgi:hypothetical protein